MGRLP